MSSIANCAQKSQNVTKAVNDLQNSIKQAAKQEEKGVMDWLGDIFGNLTSILIIGGGCAAIFVLYFMVPHGKSMGAIMMYIALLLMVVAYPGIVAWFEGDWWPYKDKDGKTTYKWPLVFGIPELCLLIVGGYLLYKSVTENPSKTASPSSTLQKEPSAAAAAYRYVR